MVRSDDYLLSIITEWQRHLPLYNGDEIVSNVNIQINDKNKCRNEFLTVIFSITGRESHKYYFVNRKNVLSRFVMCDKT